MPVPLEARDRYTTFSAASACSQAQFVVVFRMNSALILIGFWICNTHTHFQLAGRFRHKSSGKIINQHGNIDYMSDIHLLEKGQVN